MKRIVTLLMVLALGFVWTGVQAKGGTKVRFDMRTKLTEQALVSGTEYSISVTAGTTVFDTHDILIWNTSTDTTSAFWKLKGTYEGSVDADGATLAASTGAILLEDVPGFVVLDWSGAGGIMTILSGGDR